MMWLLLAVPLLVMTPDPRLNHACMDILDFERFDLLEEPDHRRLSSTQAQSLDDRNLCNWHPGNDLMTPAVVFQIAPTKRHLSFEIYGTFSGGKSLTMNVALLDHERNILKVAPFTSFWMRKGRPRLTFVLAPNPDARWLLVTGANNAPDVVGRYSQRGFVSKSLAVAGMEFSDTPDEYVDSTISGQVSVRARLYITPRISE